MLLRAQSGKMGDFMQDSDGWNLQVSSAHSQHKLRLEQRLAFTQPRVLPEWSAA